MADSAVAITAGAGTNVDTRTEGTNGNHRQVIVIGDPATNAGVAPVDATNGLAVDVKAVVPGTGATNLGKAEDAGHTSGDVGVMALSVRQNTAAALSGADADYQPLITDTNGRLHVHPSGVSFGAGASDATTQRVTIDSGQIASLGQAAMAASSPITIASDQTWGVGATGFTKVEDAASADGDKGVPAMAVQKASPANTAGTDGDWEFLQVSGGHLWAALPVTTKASANFNRPADTTAYTANDAVADNTTAGSVTKLSYTMARSCGTIRRVKIRKSDQTVATPTIRAWFWDATFTVGAGDNAAFAAPLQDSIGFVDVSIVSAGSDDAVGWTSCDIPFAAGTVYCLLQTLSAFTPANAETFTIELHYTPG